MASALETHDPTAVTIPHTNAASTDNVAFDPLGIPGYGFVPLLLPPDYDFAAMFHGVNERIPLASLYFGAKCSIRSWTSVDRTGAARTDRVGPVGSVRRHR